MTDYEIKSRMKLTADEIQSPLWIKIKGWLEHRLKHNQTENDNHSLSLIETTRIRGRNAEIKDILSFGKPAAKAPGEE